VDGLDLTGPHKDAMPWFTAKVRYAFNRAVVLAILFVEFDTYPFACRLERCRALEADNAPALRNSYNCAQRWVVHEAERA